MQYQDLTLIPLSVILELMITGTGGAKPCGKQELVSWVYEILKIRIEEIQQLGTGVVYCLMLNHFYPRTIPETMINIGAKSEHEYVGNLKLFQAGLAKLKVKRRVEIEKISKMKFQDNWEMMGWLKRFAEDSEKGDKEKEKEKGGREREIEKERQTQMDIFSSLRFNTPGKLSISKENRSGMGCGNQCNMNVKVGCFNMNGLSTPMGKSSVTASLVQNNYLGIIERMKEVLMNDESDQQKVRVLQMLLNIKGKDREKEGLGTKEIPVVCESNKQ